MTTSSKRSHAPQPTKTSDVTELASLVAEIRETILKRGLGAVLETASLRVEPILNWGGFVNRSFRISDGERRYFLKLSRDPDAKGGLERWYSLADAIEDRYHGPHAVAWFEAGTTGYAGALFGWLEGRAADHLEPDLRGSVSRVVTRLHADAALGDRLRAAGDPVVSCADAYLRSYHARFAADLALVATEPPPFLSRRHLGWMQKEADELADRVRESDSFEHPADKPIHSDLWVNNVMVDRRGKWHMLDWDGLQLGDPVMDWAMLLGPSRDRPKALVEEEVSTHAPLGAAERQRLGFYARAGLLDWVIDPLSDWVEAANEPEHGEQIRRANQRVHEQAAAEYRRAYDS
jgi:aminoglycoside phosphotransferase (APT) family kinase protein